MIKTSVKLLCATYFLSLIFISQVALLKCTRENDSSKLSCPIMRNEIRFIDKHFISSRMIEPVMAYLDVFDTSVINILILSGYLALLGEVIALSYAIFKIPFIAFNAVCSAILKVMVIIVLGIFIYKQFEQYDSFNDYVVSLQSLPILNQIEQFAEVVLRRVGNQNN